MDTVLGNPGRGKRALHLASFDTVARAWKFLDEKEFLTDKVGWCLPQYYKTICVTAMHQKLYIFGRGKHKLHLLSFDTAEERSKHVFI